MLKVALCDDNHDSIEQYAWLLSRIAQKNKIEIELSYFYNGESLIFHYGDIPTQVDIVYLDIFMDETDGMETARRLRESGCKAQIIFLTSCEEYVYEAFDVNAIHYLLKEDTDVDKFERVFLKAVEAASKKAEEHFVFEFGGESQFIPLSQISYFEILQRIVTVHYGDGETAKFYSSMEQVEERLRKKGFARSHRSYLVHLQYIAKFQQQRLRLRSGEEVPIGITYMKSLKKQFSDYISRLCIYKVEGSDKESGTL